MTGGGRAALVLVLAVLACGRSPRSAAEPVPRTDSAPPPVSTPVPASPPSTPPATTPPRPRPTPPAAPASPVSVARPGEADSIAASRRATLVTEGERIGTDEVGYYMDVLEARLRQLAANGYEVTRRDSGIVVLIPGRVTFEVSSARLIPAGLAGLTALGKVLADYRFTLVTLHGYTDSSGEPQANIALSQARAISLARQLITDGVVAKRIIAVGHGAAGPIADNTSADGRERNRRIELRLDPLKL